MSQNSDAKTNNSKRILLSKETKIGELLQNDTRLSILMYLRMNARLSFGEIARLVGKSKSTVHHHLQKLIGGGLVREIQSQEQRNQFNPKYYQLVPGPKKVYTFSDINQLPLEEQVSAFLTTTKLSQHAFFYLYQILGLLNNYLDTMEKIIESDEGQAHPEILQKLWEGAPEFVNQEQFPIKFKDIYYFNTLMSEKVYRKYIKELSELQTRISEYKEQDEKQGGSKKKPYFIYHVFAPLGKPFILESSRQQDT
ncbi:MAG: winged helix-turn-helix domain-containing protein [Candidatus Odinarchaeota archaeon]